ncbi:MAG: adenylate/guanylate cyclase domain-containing protein [Pseudomonadota bacterium]
MRSLDKQDLKTLLVTGLIGSVIGAVYTQLIYLSEPGADGSIWLGVGIGGTIGTLITYFEMYYVGRPDAPIRNLSFWASLLVRAGAHGAIIIGSILFWQYLYQVITGIPVILLNASAKDNLTDLLFSFGVVIAIIFYMQMRLFIGPRTLRNLLVGRYHKPQTEDRIFVVFDLVGSTAYAQAHGDIKFYKLLNRFFNFIDDSVHRHGGEIHSYVGDAMFAVWPVTNDAERDADPLRALAGSYKAIEKAQQQFENEFGTKPSLRAAIHVGTVVMGETGFRKRQITYLGNTVNIVARIETLTKSGLGSFLASDDYISRVCLPEGLKATDMGETVVKGATEPISIFKLDLAG